MKIISLLVLLCVSSLTGRAQVTRAELESHLLHKPLILRGLYAGEHLAFDSHGQPLSQYPQTPFTLSGLDVERVKIHGDVADIDAERVGLRYDMKAKRFDRVRTGGRKVRISVHLTGVTDAGALLDLIFTNNPASFGPELPDYWKAFFHVAGGSKTELQTFKINDPNTSTFKPSLPAVTAPIIRFQPEPTYTDEARREKLSGNCMIILTVDASGLAKNVRILHPLGLGLDEKAVEAVNRYQFTPAMKDGQPVAVVVTVVVNFHIY